MSENDQPDYPRHQIHELLEVEMKTIEVPILGIQIYIEDMPILGGLGITLLLLWFYFVRRRERSIVKMLHSVATYAKPQEKKYQIKKIYTSLAFSQLFNTIPNIDNFAKSNFRNPISKLLSFLNVNWPSAKIFSFLMPFVPCGVIAFVLIVDFIETFSVESDQKLIPKKEYLMHFDSTLFSCEDQSCDSLQTEFADSLFEKKRLLALTTLIDSAKFIRQDSLKTGRQNALIPLSQRFLRLKKAEMAYNDSIQIAKDSIFSYGTTAEYYRYRKHQFHDFMHQHARFGIPIGCEIIWIRSVLPSLIVLFNFFIALSAFFVAQSRDFHMKGIFIQYEKYYPQNYKIYDIPYAYLTFRLINTEGEGIKNVRIDAINNCRNCKTDDEGFARFFELQEIDEPEKFIFDFKNNKTVGWCSYVSLEKIGRYPIRIIKNNNNKGIINKHLAENINKSIEENRREEELIEKIRSIMCAHSPKSKKAKFKWIRRDDRNKPMEYKTCQPISRHAATKELVNGEMIICYQHDGVGIIKETKVLLTC